MDGFKRPDRPAVPRVQKRETTVQTSGVVSNQPIASQSTEPIDGPKPERLEAKAADSSAIGSKLSLPSSISRKVWYWVLGGILLIAAVVVGGWFTYQQQLKPVDPADKTVQQIVIDSGETFGQVASKLKQRNLIHSVWAFEVFARVEGKVNSIKLGTCSLTRRESASEILDKITSGCHDFKAITFYPGGTIYPSRWKPNSLDVVDVLLKAGYERSEIDAALAKSYVTEPIDLFADKPKSADLEGYIYGETYYVATDASVEDILQTAFNQMASDIADNGYIEKFKSHGLNLFEGITLASIVQRELSCSSNSEECFLNQRQIAQVFYNRLNIGMSLGSDVTFYYGADKLGVDPAVDLNSPYNTRIRTGLTPGPISAPGIHALGAVADPAPGEYMFFIAGDDGKVYFGRTQAEHEQNIALYCQKLCSEL